MAKRRFSRGNRWQQSRGRTQTKRGEMNKTEGRFVTSFLNLEPGLLRFWYEPFSLRLTAPEVGTGVRYSPDFLALYECGRTVIYEVKGSGPVNEASMVRAKVAAETFPLWEFFIAKERTRCCFELKQI